MIDVLIGMNCRKAMNILAKYLVGDCANACLLGYSSTGDVAILTVEPNSNGGGIYEFDITCPHCVGITLKYDFINFKDAYNTFKSKYRLFEEDRK